MTILGTCPFWTLIACPPQQEYGVSVTGAAKDGLPMNVQLRQPAEDRKRQILIKHLLELSRHMAMEGWTYEDAFVCWAIRLASYEGRRADMPYLLAKTGLTRQTIQRRLEANREARNIAVHWTGKRKHYSHTPHADRQVIEYYAILEGILNNWCEETYRDTD